MRKAAVSFGSLLVLILLIAAAGWQPYPTSPTIRTDVNLVQLQATVTDGAGRAVSGLPKDAFELFVDDERQPITVFQGEDAPVSAGIVVDNSASMAPKRSDVIAAALAFARASNPHDQMFVIHFSTHTRFGLPEGQLFTSDVTELERAISRFQLGGTTALYDALLVGIARLDSASEGLRKVLLLITDGGDNSSTATVDDVLNASRRSGTALYAIGIFDPADRDRNPALLTELANATGGEAHFPTTSGEVARICERIATQIRLQYTLGFAGAQDDKYHTIRLVVRDPRFPKLTVHTRAGYFAARP